MRLIEKHGLVDRFENDPDCLLDESVLHRGYAQRSCFAVALRNIDPSGWSEAISTLRYTRGNAGQL